MVSTSKNRSILEGCNDERGNSCRVRTLKINSEDESPRRQGYRREGATLVTYNTHSVDRGTWCIKGCISTQT